MTRESASRPRSSVPSQWPVSAPGSQKGGVAPRTMSCSSGSFGAIQGAPSASTSKMTMKPPPAITLGSRKHARTESARRREPIEAAAPAVASSMAQARVRCDDEQVYDHVDDDEEGPENKR